MKLFALLLLPFFALSSVVIKVVRPDKLIKDCLQNCLSFSSGERVWYEYKLKKLEDTDILKRARTARELAKVNLGDLKKCKSKMSEKLKGFVGFFEEFTAITFFKDAVVEHKKAGVRVKVASAKFLNSLPSIFDELEAAVGVDRKDRSLLYGYILTSTITDGDVGVLEKDIYKHLICSQDPELLTQTLCSLSIGLLAKSQNNLKYWSDIYWNVVKSMANGKEEFWKLFPSELSDFSTSFSLIINSRKPAFVKTESFTTISEFVKTAIITDLKSDEFVTAPYMFAFEDEFQKHLRDLLNDKKIQPHPVTGKLMLANKLSKNERSLLIKMFKLMAVLNMNLPRLALSEEEYISANKIMASTEQQTDESAVNGEKNVLFMYGKDLETELLKVTRDISAHFSRRTVRVGVDGNDVINKVFKENPQICHQFFYMVTGECLDGSVPANFYCSAADRKVLLVYRETPASNVFINFDMSEEEYLELFSSMQKTSFDGKVVFAAIMPEAAIFDDLTESETKEETIPNISVGTNSSATVLPEIEKSRIEQNGQDFNFITSQVKYYAEIKCKQQPTLRGLNSKRRPHTLDAVIKELAERLAQFDNQEELDILVSELLAENVIVESITDKAFMIKSQYKNDKAIIEAIEGMNKRAKALNLEFSISS